MRLANEESAVRAIYEISRPTLGHDLYVGKFGFVVSRYTTADHVEYLTLEIHHVGGSTVLCHPAKASTLVAA